MRNRRVTRMVTLMAMAALLVSACGGGNGTATTATTAPAGFEVTVTATEFAFEPANIEVPAGVPVTIVLVNSGVIEHDFSIDALGLTIHADPGETVRETVNFAAGTYEVHCTVPGHHEAGMEGTLVAG